MNDKRKIYKNKAFIPIMIITCLFGFLSITCIIFAVNYQKGDTISREYFIRYAIVAAMIFALSILYLIFGIIDRKSKAALVLAYIISYCAFFIVMSLLATYPIFAWHTFKYNVILLVFIVAVITINIAVCIKNKKKQLAAPETITE
jgi:predicted tellurium resistance membrane protein TerC